LIQITINDGPIQALLAGFEQGAHNTEPAMRAIGEYLIEVAKHSFEVSASPSGDPWPANSDVTIARYLEQTTGNYKKDGKLSSKGATRVANKKPLIGASRDLSRQFSYAATADSVTIQNSMVYAAMQQFGGTKAQFPHLWGDIPARPFFPLDAAGNLTDVAVQFATSAVRDYLDQLLGM
jgi:phage gpG-like protein